MVVLKAGTMVAPMVLKMVQRMVGKMVASMENYWDPWSGFQSAGQMESLMAMITVDWLGETMDR